MTAKDQRQIDLVCRTKIQVNDHRIVVRYDCPLYYARTQPVNVRTYCSIDSAFSENLSGAYLTARRNGV
jgi:hypothetical protein